MDLLARREHARLELDRKLSKAGFDGDIISSTLDDLEQDGLLANDRFAESFIRSRVNRGQGPVKIRAELSQRGIDDGEAYLRASGCDWRQLATEARIRRFGPQLPDSYSEKGRQARFLAQRGFTAEQIRDALEFADYSD